MFEEEKKDIKAKKQKKISQARLKNIALYYLERFESSSQNLRAVLRRRVEKYAYENSEFDKPEAYGWVDLIVEDFVRLNYINDERYANLQTGSYIRAGKSSRYIKNKLREKGIDEEVVEKIIDESEYNPFESAQKLAIKKKLGKYNPDEEKRAQNKQKDFAKMMRAGFEYSIVAKILGIDEEF